MHSCGVQNLLRLGAPINFDRCATTACAVSPTGSAWQLCSGNPSVATVSIAHSTKKNHPNWVVSFCGCGGKTRTCDLRVMSPTSYQLLYPAIFCSVVPVTGLEPVQYRYRGILSPLCLPIPPHRQLSAMIRIPYSPVIVKHGQGKPFKFFRQLPLQKVQTGARFRAIFRPEAHILAENPNAKEEIK